MVFDSDAVRSAIFNDQIISGASRPTQAGGGHIIKTDGVDPACGRIVVVDRIQSGAVRNVYISLPDPPVRLSLPRPPSSVSLPDPPLNVLIPLLPVKVLARVLPVALIAFVPVKVSFSTLVVRV